MGEILKFFSDAFDIIPMSFEQELGRGLIAGKLRYFSRGALGNNGEFRLYILKFAHFLSDSLTISWFIHFLYKSQLRSNSILIAVSDGNDALGHQVRSYTE